jgi:hypothetical protein
MLPEIINTEKEIIGTYKNFLIVLENEEWCDFETKKPFQQILVEDNINFPLKLWCPLYYFGETSDGILVNSQSQFYLSETSGITSVFRPYSVISRFCLDGNLLLFRCEKKHKIVAYDVKEKRKLWVQKFGELVISLSSTKNNIIVVTTKKIYFLTREGDIEIFSSCHLSMARVHDCFLFALSDRRCILDLEGNLLSEDNKLMFSRKSYLLGDKVYQ